MPRAPCRQLGREGGVAVGVDAAAGADGVEHAIGGGLEGFEAARVFEDEVGEGDFFGERHLCADSGGRFVFGRAVTCAGACNLHVFWDGDDDEGAEHVGEPVFHQERRLVAGEGLAPRVELGGTLHAEGADARMNDGVERAPLRVVGEHERRHGFAIERSVGGEHAGAERAYDLGEPFGADGDGLAREEVCVEDGDAPRPQPRCNGRLARCDAAGEAEEMKGHVLDRNRNPRQESLAVESNDQRTPTSQGPEAQAAATPKPGRRRLLVAGIASGALVAIGSVVALVRTSGYDVPPQRARAFESLDAAQYVFVQHAARRIAAPDRDGDGAIPSPDDTDVAGFVDAYVAKMHPTVRRDLFRLFAYVEHIAPLRSGLRHRFTSLGPADQDRVLAALEAADEGLLRGGFEGLKALVFMGYYRDPRTWSILGYDGPTLKAPL